MKTQPSQTSLAGGKNDAKVMQFFQCHFDTFMKTSNNVLINIVDDRENTKEKPRKFFSSGGVQDRMAKTTSIHVKHSKGVRTISPVVKGTFLSKSHLFSVKLFEHSFSEHNIYCCYVLGVIRLSKYKSLLTIVLKVMKIEMMLSQTIHHSDKSCCVSLVKFLQLKASSS